jgi:hypothetical protein
LDDIFNWADQNRSKGFGQQMQALLPEGAVAKLMARQAEAYVARWESRFGADGARLAYRFRLLYTAGIGMMLVVMVVMTSLDFAGFRSHVVFWTAMVLAASPAIVGTFLLGRAVNLIKAHCGITKRASRMPWSAFANTEAFDRWVLENR